MTTNRSKFMLVVVAVAASVVSAIVPVSPSDNIIDSYGKKSVPPRTGSPLYPRATFTRDIRNLNGIWNFRLSPQGNPLYGFVHEWYLNDLDKTGPVIPMPVPSSYQDVGVDDVIRDFTGVVWYDRRFYVPYWWGYTKQRVWLRFGSVHYQAKVVISNVANKRTARLMLTVTVAYGHCNIKGIHHSCEYLRTYQNTPIVQSYKVKYVNGKLVTSHEIGHLPFEVEITDDVLYNNSNLLTVAVDNKLTVNTIPQDNQYDFFNYAGIHRPVYVYTTPNTYIEDIVVNTDIQGYTGIITYNLTVKSLNEDVIFCHVVILDRNKTQVGEANNCSGVIDIPQANLWWPYLMHEQPGYMYTLTASLVNSRDELVDTYSEPIGIRTIRWTNTSVYLNDAPLYLRGFGMHEDSDFRGKGWDRVLWVRNLNLIKWIRANAFRTSHYPYSEEIYQLADEHGIMIIDECPSVNADFYSESLLDKHKESLTELIRRDKNHPSVIMWSIANEPVSGRPNSDDYFRQVVKHVKSMDVSRPVTYALSHPNDISGKHLDVISFNRYNGWYTDAGNLQKIAENVEREARSWHQKYNRSVLMSEYGADTIAGMHFLPTFVFSEDYQVALMSEHFKAFDKLRQRGFFIGEFIWNFADFKTKQGITRAGGNKKGIFTRSRQPKAAAHHLQARYMALAAADIGETPPPPQLYISDHKAAKREDL